MPEQVLPGPVGDAAIREAVCVHTKKIFDSCRDKDCIEDLRFFPTQTSLSALERALSVKAGQAELIYVCIDVEPINFNHGFFTVDVRYYYRVTADAFVGASRPVEITGLAVFDKRVILFGSEASAKVFRSDAAPVPMCQSVCGGSSPTCVVEAVDPLVLGTRLLDVCENRPCDCELTEVPDYILTCFDSDLVFSGEGKRLYITLGQFSIIRLERDTQLLMPAYDYCMPDRECGCGSEEDPCEIFRQVRFPVDEFFPPNTPAPTDLWREARGGSCCS